MWGKIFESPLIWIILVFVVFTMYLFSLMINSFLFGAYVAKERKTINDVGGYTFWFLLFSPVTIGFSIFLLSRDYFEEKFYGKK